MRIKYNTGCSVDYVDAYYTPEEAVEAEGPSDEGNSPFEPTHKEMGLVSALDARGSRWWGIVPIGLGTNATKEDALKAEEWWDEAWDSEIDEE